MAIVGAGLSALVLANTLKERFEVTLIEKSRGVGGRMATRYADPWRFDHGAQFFTARSKSFRTFLAPLIEAGVVAAWDARFAELTRSKFTAERRWGEDYPHFVAVPGMNALPKALAEGLDIRLATQVDAVLRSGGSWLLETGDGDSLDGFDWLVLSAPAEQTAALAPAGSELAELAAAVSMKACFALMLGFDVPQATAFDAARVLDADISWVSVNSSKPGRADAFTLLVHATNRWADEHLDDDAADVEAHLLDELADVTGIDGRSAAHRQLHRWRYANIDRQDGPRCYVDPATRIAACGDWFIRGRVEAAYRSAVALAARLAGETGA